jgi:predicted phosphodiesterase
LEIQCFGAYGELEFDGKRIALMHGDDVRLKQRVLAEQKHDYLIQGHTHIREDTRIGRTRIINPGALHRTTQKSVAMLDTAIDRLHWINVNVG